MFSKKRSKVRRNIYPGNTGSLWKAVKKAKDVNTSDLPHTMYEDNVPIDENKLPDKIANQFNTKIINLANDANLNDEVYNGRKKTDTDSGMFIDPTSIRKCVQSLKGLKFLSR